MATTDSTGVFALYTAPGSHEIGALDIASATPIQLDAQPGYQWLPTVLVRPRSTDVWAGTSASCVQDGGIDVAGFVADVFTGKLLHGAQAYLAGRPCGMLTDSLGRFQLAGVQAGDTLIIQLIGYRPVRVPINRGEGIGRALRTPMIPLPVTLDHVVPNDTLSND